MAAVHSPLPGLASASEPAAAAAEPLQMVSWDADAKKFAMVNEGAVSARFATLPKPLKIVAVIGALRTGKSFLMNCLYHYPESPFGRGDHGFALGGSVTPVTKGIWMWAKRLPAGEGSLILLDTEGLKDPNHPDPAYDAKVFAITIALCKTLIYNVMKYADASAIDDLGAVAQLATHFAFRTADTELRLQDAAKFFPRLEFLVRDFTLALEDEDGDEITPKEWLEQTVLAISDAVGAAGQSSRDTIKSSIKRLFNHRDLTTLPAPTSEPRLLRQMAQATEAEVRPEFQAGMRSFTAKVLAQVEPVRMLAPNGAAASTVLDGPAYLAFARGVVASLNAEKVCVETAMSATASAMNVRTFDAAEAVLKREMECIALPATEAVFARGRSEAMRRADAVLQAECVVIVPPSEPTKAELSACKGKEAKAELRAVKDQEASRAEELKLALAFNETRAQPLLAAFEEKNRALSDVHWRKTFGELEEKARQFANGCMRAGGAAEFAKFCAAEFGIHATAAPDDDGDDVVVPAIAGASLPSHGLASVRDDLFDVLANKLRGLGETVMNADRTISTQEAAQLKAELEAAQKQRESDAIQRKLELATVEQQAQKAEFEATIASVKQSHMAALEETRVQQEKLVQQLRDEATAAAERHDDQMQEVLQKQADQETKSTQRFKKMADEHKKELTELQEDADFTTRTAAQYGIFFNCVSDEQLAKWKKEAREAKKKAEEAEKKRKEEAAKKKANGESTDGGCIVA